MATILLSAAGAALGGALGGGALGLSSAVIGRAIGATIGRAIDQSLMGSGSETVETGKLDRMRVMGASEGSAIPRVFGRVRVPGNVIWTSNYLETVTEYESGGKGAPKGPTTRAFSYSINVAIGICEGEISRVGRIWADGQIVNKSVLNLRVYTGSGDQLPDPAMSAIEADGEVPAYRGLAYVVFENLELEPFGNRVPQFTFEVIRAAQPVLTQDAASLADVVKGVALLPGSGEYSLATTPVYQTKADGSSVAVNQNSEGGQVDFLASLEALSGELPAVTSTSLVVSWFGNDLRAGHCVCQPKVEDGSDDLNASGLSGLGRAPVGSASGVGAVSGARANITMPWSVAGLSRAEAQEVAQSEGRPVYGGTPCDASVVEAIAALKDAGQEVMFYPFLLMEVLAGNSLPDPWSGDVGQANLPWRGRITTELAPGQAGSTDGTAAARAEVAAFMGTVAASDFAVVNGAVSYSGPDAFSYRRFVLHYAHLCAAAGGVSSFCIGSEMRALTQIRDETGAFPAVDALRVLAAEVKAILPGAKIGYAADWSEYFGYHPQDGSGDVLFHLDPLWADSAVDFIGIDNYMPISDWREGGSHLDSHAASLYDLDYLRGNIEGGEGYDWYYLSQSERDAQIRTPIVDGAHGEDWVYRYKDLRGWWGNAHHDRIGGVRSAVATSWVPGSKPIWFTELGCAAVDKGPNQPNKFQDPKSSESGLPHFSMGRRDDYVQIQYLRAYASHFDTLENNPISAVYGGPMVDMSKAHIWAWDARPWPDFPNNQKVWSDGENHIAGHWITGRSAVQTLASVVAEICEAAGIGTYDVTGLHGIVRGYVIANVEAGRASLQNLMVAFGFDAVERDGILIFRNRVDAASHVVAEAEYVLAGDADAVLETVRAPEAEIVGEVLLGYSAGEGGFENHVASARFPDDGAGISSQNDLPLVLSAPEAREIAERWLSEARVARDMVRLQLPPSRADIKAGDAITLTSRENVTSEYRVDRVQDSGGRAVEASRIERQIYTPSDSVHILPSYRSFAVPTPVSAQFMDLPLLTGDELPHAPHVAVSSNPWAGSAAVYSAPDDSGYGLINVVERPATMGLTLTPLAAAQAGLWSAGGTVRVQLQRGTLSSQDRLGVLNGANAAAIGDGSSGHWEIVQFAQANLVAPNVFELSDMLRGQAGTDGIMPEIWSEGSQFVLLDGGVTQLPLDLAQRGLDRHYRIGPSTVASDDPSYQHYVAGFDGIGLRPYAPAHLRGVLAADGLTLSWTRRTRLDGDSWASVDVPLGEEFERYVVRVTRDDDLLREVMVDAPHWSYPATLASEDGATGDITFHVAQISQSFGPGPFSRKIIHV